MPEKNYAKKTLVMYHGDCSDGFGAAYSAWKIFGSDADYVPMFYAQEFIPDVINKDVYILDFSFDIEKYENILKNAKSVNLLDHHATAMKSLCNCKGCFFDLTKSGAVLSWEYFHPKEPVPKFLKLIQDGDLWKFKHEETKPFYSAINLIEKNFELWQKFENDDYLQDFVNKGKLIQVNVDNQVRQLSHDSKTITLSGVVGLMVNAPPMFASDVGNLLARQSGTFGMVWHEHQHGIKCSLRSLAEYDVSVIAQEFGGGGHPQACGFNLHSLAELNFLIKHGHLKKHNKLKI